MQLYSIILSAVLVTALPSQSLHNGQFLQLQPRTQLQTQKGSSDGMRQRGALSHSAVSQVSKSTRQIQTIAALNIGSKAGSPNRQPSEQKSRGPMQEASGFNKEHTLGNSQHIVAAGMAGGALLAGTTVLAGPAAPAVAAIVGCGMACAGVANAYAARQVTTSSRKESLTEALRKKKD